MKDYQESYQISHMSICQRISYYLMATQTSEQIKALESLPKVECSPLLKIAITTAKSVRRMSETNSDKKPPSIMFKLKDTARSLKLDFGLGDLPLESREYQINRALYLQHFEGEYAKAQKIYRNYVQQYLEIYEQSPEEAEKQFDSLHNLTETDNYWMSSNSNLGNAMADAIGSLTTFHVQNESYKLLRALAKLGHGIALLRLNTRLDKQAVPILINFIAYPTSIGHEYAKAKLQHELLQGEMWAVEASKKFG